jgi:hypothetical protein
MAPMGSRMLVEPLGIKLITLGDDANEPASFPKTSVIA